MKKPGQDEDAASPPADPGPLGGAVAPVAARLSPLPFTVDTVRLMRCGKSPAESFWRFPPVVLWGTKSGLLGLRTSARLLWDARAPPARASHLLPSLSPHVGNVIGGRSSSLATLKMQIEPKSLSIVLFLCRERV